MGNSRRLRTVVTIAVAALVAYYIFFVPGPLVEDQAGPSAAEPGYGLRAEDSWPRLDPQAGAAAAAGANLFAANYYVVLDGSGSMEDVECSAGKRKIEAAQDALRAFADSVPADANLGLAVFEQRGLGERVPLGVGAGNRRAFARAVAQVQAGAATPLRSAIELAYDRLLAQGRRQLGYGEYHLVVVTDGAATQGEDPTRVVNRMLAESPVVLHTIGFCIGSHHSLNQPGRAYYQAADNPEALRQGLDAVLAEAPAFDVTAFDD